MTRHGKSPALLCALLCLLGAGAGAAPLSLPPDPAPPSGTSYDGGTWGTGNMSLPDAGTVTLKSGYTTTFNGTSGGIRGQSTRNFGTLVNGGTFSHESSASFAVGGDFQSVTFDNQGTIDLKDSGGITLGSGSGGVNVFTSSGTIKKTAGAMSTIQGPTKDGHPEFNGTVEVQTGLSLKLNHSPTSERAPAIGDFSAIKLGDGATMDMVGYWSSITGTIQQTGAAGSGRLRSGGTLEFADGAAIDVSGSGGLVWDLGDFMCTGSCTNRGTVIYEAGASRLLAGKPGVFVQAPGAVFIHNTASDLRIGADFNRVTLKNDGLIELRSTGGLATGAGSGAYGTISNAVLGTILKTGSGTSRVVNASTKTYTELHMYGTTEVTNGTLEIDFYTSKDLSGWWEPNNNILNAGTWIVRAAGTLNLEQIAADTSTNIKKIDDNASVILAGGTFPQMDAGVMNTLDGTLGLHERHQLTISSGLTCTNTTKWQFGIRDRSLNQTNACLFINGNSELDGTVNVCDNGDMKPGRYTIVTNVIGTLTDHGLTLGELPPRILGKLIVTEGDK